MIQAVVFQENSKRSQVICEAMQQGIQACGDNASRVMAYKYPGRPSGDVAVFYGLKDGKDQLMKDYVAMGRHVVFIDLGYWGRRWGPNRYEGFHRFSVDARHCTKLVMLKQQAPDRQAVFELKVRKWQKPDKGHVLLAGMSRKSAHSYNWGEEEWEREAIVKIREATDRQIVYRPKPSWTGAKHLPDTRFSPKEERLKDVLKNCHAVVTHHSNVACDGLLAGVPAFLDDGIALPLGTNNLARLEDPVYPSTEARQQWLNNAAYWQYTIAEMAAGVPWRFFKGLGLLGRKE